MESSGSVQGSPLAALDPFPMVQPGHQTGSSPLPCTALLLHDNELLLKQHSEGRAWRLRTTGPMRCCWAACKASSRVPLHTLGPDSLGLLKALTSVPQIGVEPISVNGCVQGSSGASSAGPVIVSRTGGKQHLLGNILSGSAT